MARRRNADPVGPFYHATKIERNIPGFDEEDYGKYYVVGLIDTDLMNHQMVTEEDLHQNWLLLESLEDGWIAIKPKRRSTK